MSCVEKRTECSSGDPSQLLGPLFTAYQNPAAIYGVQEQKLNKSATSILGDLHSVSLTTDDKIRT